MAAALGRAPALVPYPEWTSWLRTHSWNDWIVNAVLGGLVGTALGLLATVGYAVPGTVVAVAVFVPLVAFDRRFAHWADDVLGRRSGGIPPQVVAFLEETRERVLAESA